MRFNGFVGGEGNECWCSERTQEKIKGMSDPCNRLGILEDASWL